MATTDVLQKAKEYVKNNVETEEQPAILKKIQHLQQLQQLITQTKNREDAIRFLEKMSNVLDEIEKLDIMAYAIAKDVYEQTIHAMEKNQIAQAKDLGQLFGYLSASIKNADALMNHYDEKSFEWLKAKGAKFFRVERQGEDGNKHYVYYMIFDNNVYEINPQDQNSTLYLLCTKILKSPKLHSTKAKYTHSMVRNIYDTVRIPGNEPPVYREVRWFHMVPEENTLYIRMPNTEVLKIMPNVIEKIKIGETQGFYMKPSNFFREDVKFIPDMTDEDIIKTLEIIRKYVVKHATCGQDRMIYNIASQYAVLFENMLSVIPHAQYMGGKGSAKSFSAKMMSMIQYGNIKSFKTSSSTMAAINRGLENDPLYILDNVETSNMTEHISDLLLYFATGASRDKFGAKTTEALKGRIIITTIEGVVRKEEHLRRFDEVEFSYKNKTPHADYPGDEVIISEIHKVFEKFFSAMMHIISRHVLPALENGYYRRKSREYAALYTKEGAENLAGFETIVALILEGFAKYGMKLSKDVDEYMKHHITKQKLNDADASDMNIAIRMLCEVVENTEQVQIVHGKHGGYGCDVITDTQGRFLGIKGTAGQLENVVRLRAKNLGMSHHPEIAKLSNISLANRLKSNLGRVYGGSIEISMEKDPVKNSNIYIFKKVN